jgi:hypothetical protein
MSVLRIIEMYFVKQSLNFKLRRGSEFSEKRKKEKNDDDDEIKSNLTTFPFQT